MTNPYDFWAAYGVGCFPIKEKSKDPLEGFKWAQYVDAPASSETREAWLKLSGNHAVIAGDRIIIMDWENEEDIFNLFKKFDVFCKEHYVVKTGKGYHVYFFRSWQEPYAQVKKNGKIICEIRTGAHYVVGAGCTHPSGKKYTLIGKDAPQELSKSGFEEMKAKLVSMGYDYRRTGETPLTSVPLVPVEEILAHREKDKKLDDLLNGSIEGYPSRSEAELALVCKLLFYNATKEQIWSIMESGNIGKWKERPESYKYMTYNRGIQFLSQKIWQFPQNPQTSAKSKNTPIFFDDDPQPSAKTRKNPQTSPIPLRNGALVLRMPFLINITSQTPTKWLLPGFVPERSICMLAAKRASMKTFMALYFAASATTGCPNVLGQPEPVPTLYLDYENGEFELARRARGIIAGNPEIQQEHLNNMHVVVSEIKLDRDGGIELLADVVNVTGARLVFIDTQRRLTDGEENASETSNSILDGLKKVITATGCSFVLLHHMRKGNPQKGIIEDAMDEIRGSSDIAASCAVIFSLSRKGSSDTFVLRQLKNRFGSERKPIQMHIEGQAPSAVKIVSDGEIEEAVVAENALASGMWEWLVSERLFEFKTQDIKIHFVGTPPDKYSSRSVEDALAVLLSINKIERVSKGHYRMVLPKKQEKILKEHGSLKTGDG